MRDLESERCALFPESDLDLRPVFFVTLDGDRLDGDLELLRFDRFFPPGADTDLSLEDDRSLRRPDLPDDCFGVLERLRLDFFPLVSESDRDLDLERDCFFFSF